MSSKSQQMESIVNDSDPLSASLDHTAATEEGSTNTLLVRKTVHRLHSWIATYVQSKLDPSASPSDFTARIERRLLARLGKDLAPDPRSLADAVHSTVKSLVHEDRRLAFRRAKLYDSNADIEKIEDPDSLEFASRLEIQSRVEFIRRSVPTDLQPLVDSLFGFAGGEDVSVAELANQLGIQRNTLDHRLHRLYAKLRKQFRSAP